MVDESTSCHKQAITTLKSGEVDKNHLEERNVEQNEEQIEVPQDLHREKGKEESTEASSSSPPIPEMPYEPQAPIPVHDSLPNERLFENTQRDLPRYAKIRNYLSIGKIHSLWSMRRKDWCFKFKFKGQRTLSAPRIWISFI